MYYLRKHTKTAKLGTLGNCTIGALTLKQYLFYPMTRVHDCGRVLTMLLVLIPSYFSNVREQ